MVYKLPLSTTANELVAKIETLSGQNLYKCYQCGKCSAGCPFSSYMDILPNQVIRYILIGAVEALLKVNTIRLCATCFTCTVRCPKGLDIARFMDALRQLLLRSGYDIFELQSLSEAELKKLPQIMLVAATRKLTS